MAKRTSRKNKDKFDVDEEIAKIGRKTNINIQRSEYAFETQIKNLENDLDNIANNRIETFNEATKLREKYLEIDYKDPAIDRYRAKLNKIGKIWLSNASVKVLVFLTFFLIFIEILMCTSPYVDMVIYFIL